ncbi:hypothetical protein VT99_11942 [Candidatus Electrothrix marina]|uniref:Uncharacterized protein n=1 Tax=Candidatus Electrothrix marina TaxID=1859130 RepID=A0A444J145_9BACT|nr:hypothetical protein VT99_11942 [Candidatus Electrothrix marina]
MVRGFHLWLDNVAGTLINPNSKHDQLAVKMPTGDRRRACCAEAGNDLSGCGYFAEKCRGKKVKSLWDGLVTLYFIDRFDFIISEFLSSSSKFRKKYAERQQPISPL